MHFDVVYYIYVLSGIMQIARIKIAFNLVISYLPQMNTSYIWKIRIRLQSNLKYAITSMGSLKEVLLFSWVKNCCFNRNFNNPLHFCRKKLPFNKFLFEKWVCWKISFVWMYLLLFEPLDLHLTCFLSCQRMLYICTWWNEKCFIIFPEVKNLFINYNYISPKRQSACAIIRKMLAN